MTRISLLVVAALGLSACDELLLQPGGSNGDFIRELPEEVIALAAPNQDLTAVKLLPEDNCFWYRHVGPVETTLLPLRTAEGRPICASSE